MRRFWFLILMVAIPLAALFIVNARLDADRTFNPPTASCQEDEPCWNCKTMGNHVCGPVQVALHPVICRMEPSSTPEGYELVKYPAGPVTDEFPEGFEVPCP